jgi:hypothetical protein
MSGLDPFVTRRNMLYRGGMGIGALALSGVMRDAFALDAAATSLCPHGQARDSLVPQRRSVARRYVRPQAGTR